MYLLDANVLSEMMKAQKLQDKNFVKWSQEQELATLFISSFTLSEIYQGIYILPKGQKRTALYQTIKSIEGLFESSILNFDLKSAEQFGIVRERTKSSGLTMDMPDSYFLAVAERHNLKLVSRNQKHFEKRTELEIVNPWDEWHLHCKSSGHSKKV